MDTLLFCRYFGLIRKTKKTLETMAFIEDFGKQKRADEQAEREAREPKRIPLARITGDPAESRLFAAYLEQGEVEDVNEGEEDPSRIRLDKKSLGEKLFKGEELTEADIDALYEETGKYFAIKERANAVRQRIEQNKDALVHASPEFRKIMELAGPGVVESALLDRFQEIAITHPEVLASLEGSFAKFSEAGRSIEAGNERIAAYCKEYNLTEDEYMAALRKREAGDPYALEDLVKSKMSAWKKLKTKFGSYEEFMSGVSDDLDRRDYIKEKLAAADEGLAEAGGILRATLFGNKDAKQILEANLEHKEGPTPKMTFFEAREMLNTSFDEQKMRADWERYKTSHENDADFDVDAARKEFARDAISKKMPKKKRGFWATVITAFLSSGLEEKLK